MPLISAEAVGRALPSARERRGLTLAKMAEQTKMAARHLEAVEQARFDGFAAPVHALGFARNYARAGGLPLQRVSHCLRGEIFAIFDERVRFDLGRTAGGLEKGT